MLASIIYLNKIFLHLFYFNTIQYLTLSEIFIFSRKIKILDVQARNKHCYNVES